MKHLRFKLAAILAWFFFIYNIEKLFGVVNIATYVYVLIFIYSIMLALIRPLQRLALHWLLLASLLPYFILKAQSGVAISGIGLPLLVTEICAILITVVLIRNMSNGLEEIREAITKLTLGNLTKGSEAFDSGQSRVYREIRRARRYQRPASLLAISTTPYSKEISLDRFIKDAQHQIIDEYIAARVSNLLANEIGDPGVILRRDKHFITLLPETDQEKAIEMANKLRTAAQENLGLEFKVGMATFPDEAVTFESLLQNAEADMTSPTTTRPEKTKLTGAQVNRALS